MDALDLVDATVACVDDESPFRRILVARRIIADAEQELRDAVAAARATGLTWAEVGSALDTTAQAACMRFGPRTSRSQAPSSASPAAGISTSAAHR